MRKLAHGSAHFLRCVITKLQGKMMGTFFCGRLAKTLAKIPILDPACQSTEAISNSFYLYFLVELGKVVKNLGMASQAKVGRGFVVALSLATIKRKDQGWPTESGSSQGWPAEREP